MSNYQHGHNRKNSSTYRSWLLMKRRCYDCGLPHYKYYGGRGIKVCLRWKHKFKNFLEDMGERPEGTELDRKDNDGDYTPENCRWTTHKRNTQNKQNSRFITANGITKSISEWSKELGISASTISSRINTYKWEEEKAITTPIKKK